ncbi:MAG: hypothetical protein C0504_16340 [Candidatus Solibacter sp.]|nr:hypothetical protein [Candidatus Solibacter sp.]
MARLEMIIEKTYMREIPSLIAALLLGVSWAAPASLRPFEVGDLFRLESFGAVAPSPDGKLVAFVRVRPKGSAKVQQRNFMNGMDRSDVWVYDAESHRSVRITDGERDGSGFFSPSWSPDGKRLALLSTRGERVGLWLWRRADGALSKASSATVQLERPVWTSNRHIVCAAPPEGEQPTWFNLDLKATFKAPEAWARARRGNEVTASELVSPPASQLADRPQGRMLKFDVLAGTVSVLAKGLFSGISASPDGRSLAAFELAEVLVPRADGSLPNRNPSMYRLIAMNEGERRIVVEFGEEEPIPPAIAWLADGTIAVRVARSSSRPDWIAVRPDGRRVNLTRTMSAAPSSVLPHPDGASLLAVENRQLWKIPASGAPTAVAGSGDVRIETIVFPECGAVVVRASLDGRRGLYAVDVNNGRLTALPAIGEESEPVAYIPATSTLLFTGPEKTGGIALRSVRASQSSSRLVAAANEFTDSIAAGSLQSFSYRSPGGSQLIGWLLLPPHFQPGIRYPTVVSAYPGLVYSAAVKPRTSIQNPSAYHPQLLAAKGYVVLFPSVPLPPGDGPAEPFAAIPEGVLPAVEEAVRMGIVDDGRVAAFGHSFGGYAALSLAAQTSRFKAIIAVSGFSNLLSLYGAIDPRYRYEAHARDRLIFMVFAESGQFRMGAPPWEDPLRYTRNSPISFVDRVSTPVMIVQGDQDYVPIQQGEEFFSALYRQRKPAIFVRYWGEGHIVESPANIKDVWKRIYEWLSRYLQPARHP